MPLTVNGVILFTRRVGSGPLVVVWHGGPGAHHDYLLPQYDRLARGRELFYYDQRGGGQSPVSRETPVGWREHVADLDGIREALGIERLTLCGYSWGGLLAVLYLLEHPSRVERLALVSPASITAQYRQQFETEFARRMAAPEVERERAALKASGLSEVRSRDVPETGVRAIRGGLLQGFPRRQEPHAVPGDGADPASRVGQSGGLRLTRPAREPEATPPPALRA